MPIVRERTEMGRVSGDKARFHKQRRQHLERRIAMRALVKKLREAPGSAAPASQKQSAES